MISRKFVELEGIKEVTQNLRNAGRKMGIGADRGLRKAGLLLLRESQKVVPVQTGNLKGSGFIRAFGSGMKTDVIIGYTALYAAYVHEDVGKAHGEEFNVKYAELIATRAQRGRRRRKMGFMHDVGADPYFRRGENQQAKYIEHPARENRDRMLSIIGNEMKRLK